MVLEQVLKSYLEYICGQNNVRENVSMKNYTTFHVGGPARFFVKVTSKKMLLRLISALNFIEYKYRVIGGGSNLLVSDKGFDGVIIKLDYRDIVENGHFIYADAGAPLHAVVNKAMELGLGGLEFAYGLPGTVGGAIFGNAGAFGSNMASVVPMVDVLVNGEIKSMDAFQCKFAYRTSFFQNNRHYIILGAYFSLVKRDTDIIKQNQEQYLAARKMSQPGGFSAGSVFRNPPDKSAGQLIDGLGLKNLRIGGAVVSDKHANFIINDGTATAGDIIKLIRTIKKRVRDAYGINLKTEIEIIT